MSANISEEKAGYSVELEISSYREGEKGIRYSFIAVAFYLMKLQCNMDIDGCR